MKMGFSLTTVIGMEFQPYFFQGGTFISNSRIVLISRHAVVVALKIGSFFGNDEFVMWWCIEICVRGVKCEIGWGYFVEFHYIQLHLCFVFKLCVYVLDTPSLDII